MTPPVQHGERYQNGHDRSAIWFGPATRPHIGHRQQRAVRHREVKRLLTPQRSMQHSVEHLVVAAIWVVLLGVSVVGAGFMGFLVIGHVWDFLRSHFGGY